MTKILADSFVTPRFEPADDASRLALLGLIVELTDAKDMRASSREKWAFALCDVIGAVRQSKTGYLAWPLNEDKFYDACYSRHISETLKRALTQKGWLEQVQRGRRGVCQIYRLYELVDCSGIALRKYGKSSLVVVRDAAKISPFGNKRKGKRLRHSRFEPQISLEIEKVQRVNDMMTRHPLRGADGSVWSNCFRAFNEGSLKKGGRIYGEWQGKKAEDRLAMTIDGEPVAEIDIKGSFLFLGNQLSQAPITLNSDPYQAIRFVANAEDVREKSNLRQFAKLIVSSMWFKEGRMAKLPRGKKYNEFGYIIPLREQFFVPHSLASKDIINDIYEAFPFLDSREATGFDLMYRESEIIVDSMLTLIEQGIPTYPVHDCLLCRKKDQELVVKALQQAMLEQMGAVAVLEVESLGQSTRVIFPEGPAVSP